MYLSDGWLPQFLANTNRVQGRILRFCASRQRLRSCGRVDVSDLIPFNHLNPKFSYQRRLGNESSLSLGRIASLLFSRLSMQKSHRSPSDTISMQNCSSIHNRRDLIRVRDSPPASLAPPLHQPQHGQQIRDPPSRTKFQSNRRNRLQYLATSRWWWRCCYGLWVCFRLVSKSSSTFQVSYILSKRQPWSKILTTHRVFLNKVVNFIGVGLALYAVASLYELVSKDPIIKHMVKCKYCRKRISTKVRAILHSFICPFLYFQNDFLISPLHFYF